MKDRLWLVAIALVAGACGGSNSSSGSRSAEPAETGGGTSDGTAAAAPLEHTYDEGLLICRGEALPPDGYADCPHRSDPELNAMMFTGIMGQHLTQAIASVPPACTSTVEGHVSIRLTYDSSGALLDATVVLSELDDATTALMLQALRAAPGCPSRSGAVLTYPTIFGLP